MTRRDRRRRIISVVCWIGETLKLSGEFEYEVYEFPFEFPDGGSVIGVV